MTASFLIGFNSSGPVSFPSPLSSDTELELPLEEAIHEREKREKQTFLLSSRWGSPYHFNITVGRWRGVWIIHLRCWPFILLLLLLRFSCGGGNRRQSGQDDLPKTLNKNFSELTHKYQPNSFSPIVHHNPHSEKPSKNLCLPWDIFGGEGSGAYDGEPVWRTQHCK